MDRDLSIFTLAVASANPSPADGGAPATPPIIPSVGYTHPSMHQTLQALEDEQFGYIYSRNGAPTPALLEEAVATLEQAESAVSFSSGMAALYAAVLSVVPPGGVIVAAQQIYGATRTLLTWLADSMGVVVHYADFLNPENVDFMVNLLRPSAIMCEVLTNPLVRVIPIDNIIEIAHRAEAAVIVDNTFATPMLIQPHTLGADLIVHSSTKYLNGHGDVLGGVIAGSESLIRVARSHRKLLGAMPGAFEAWLTLRGLRTLAIRMKQSCFSGRQVAAWLEGHPAVKQVYYPGLASDEDAHATARALFRRNHFGGMMAFELAQAGRDNVFAFIERLRIIRPVTSLGDVNSLISHPATSSHRDLTPQQLETVGISDGTLRLSIGIEEPNDLIGDLSRALSVP